MKPPNKSRYEVYYLTNEVWTMLSSQEIAKEFEKDNGWNRFIDYSSYVNVVKYNQKPATLTDRKNKAPFVQCKS